MQLLDVAVNNLHGTIPHCFGSLISMSSSPELNHSRPSGIPITNWDGEPVAEVMKGRELEYTTTLKFMFSLDLSSNNFVGLIPHELTSLTALNSLNLSHNLLSGNIPEKIGDMKWLESLDFSGNQLSGEIPPSISLLTMLSHLNLSDNNLAGNPLLCGDPLLNKCLGQEEAPTPPKIPSKENMGGSDPLDKSLHMDPTWAQRASMGIFTKLMEVTCHVKLEARKSNMRAFTMLAFVPNLDQFISQPIVVFLPCSIKDFNINVKMILDK
ncbi:hypothetical protein CRG98_026684 [Punica granatum]|uniref:Uncharacterized protein n=1 Tax=Punica granatum TaxID=22663 RepID=A0A2I0JA39_PUNGR|nr:hypothetical protein CRG98_026684 [Punica granatum]